MDSTPARLPQPKIFNLIDNTAGQAWLTKPFTTSPQAKRLTYVLCSILLTFIFITIEPTYINTKDNTLADDIYRLNTPPHNLTYSTLFQKHPQVSSYRRFHPSQELLLDIFCALLTPQKNGHNAAKTTRTLRSRQHYWIILCKRHQLEDPYVSKYTFENKTTIVECYTQHLSTDHTLFQKHMYKHTCKIYDTYKHVYMHTYIHTYIHTYVCMYTCMYEGW